MGTEIEAKYRLADPDRMRHRLTALGAAYQGAVLESNRFYDWPDGRLTGEGRGLRIRRAEAIDGPTEHRPGADVTVTVTYKGPRRPGPMKIRQEREFTADDADAVEAVLDGLGMARQMTFQKRRATWTLDGCTITLDEVPHLGSFVEIEADDDDAVAAMATRLQLTDDAMVADTYTGLLIDYCRAHGLDSTSITF